MENSALFIIDLHNGSSLYFKIDFNINKFKEKQTIINYG